MGRHVRCVARILLTGGIAIAMLAALSAQQEALFRTGVDLVNVGATVMDRRGNLIGDLKAGDFEIFEDGKKQEVRYFSVGEVVGVGSQTHLGLLMDVSGSMAPSMTFTRTAAIRFLTALTEAVDITVVDFDTEVRLARFEQRDIARLIERIRSQRAGGSTALFDAIGVYLDGASDQEGRKIMLLYTDGNDNASSLSLQGLFDLLKASDVTVYPIGQIDRLAPPAATQRFMAVLNRVAELSGGQAFFPMSLDELDAAYKQVLRQIRAQYTLGYVSTNAKTDGAWRKVEIKIVAKDGRDYRVRARDGYYGQYKPPQKP